MQIVNVDYAYVYVVVVPEPHSQLLSLMGLLTPVLR